LEVVDLSLDTSLIFAAIVGLWLVWVGPYVLRRRNALALADAVVLPVPSGAAAALPAVPSPAEGKRSGTHLMESPTPGGGTAGPVRTPGSSRPASASSSRPVQPVQAAEPVRPAQPAFRIHYGRTALALTAAAALAGTVVTVLLALFGAVAGTVPLWFLLVAVAAVASLRVLAIRNRRKRAQDRVEAAFQEAMNPSFRDRPLAGEPRDVQQPRQIAVQPAGPQTERPTERSTERPAERPAERHAPVRDSKPFDAEHGRQAAKPLTAVELRSAALEVAAKAGDAPVPVQPSTWEPKELPKPWYVEAAKAERPSPEPLALPEEPKPTTKTSIKKAAAAPKVDLPAVRDAQPATGRINLDAVLKRRRA
jgi:hypothetical protein